MHTVYFSGNRSDYQYDPSGSFTISNNNDGSDGQDTLINVLNLAFPSAGSGFALHEIDDFVNFRNLGDEAIAAARLMAAS